MYLADVTSFARSGIMLHSLSTYLLFSSSGSVLIFSVSALEMDESICKSSPGVV